MPMKNKKHIRSSHHRFTKTNKCLTILINFYDEITRPADEAIAVDIVFLEFSKAFDNAFEKVLIDKLVMHVGWMGRQTKGW